MYGSAIKKWLRMPPLHEFLKEFVKLMPPDGVTEEIGRCGNGLQILGRLALAKCLQAVIHSLHGDPQSKVTVLPHADTAFTKPLQVVDICFLGGENR